jgi:DNA excision repair protein ERCC-4
MMKPDDAADIENQVSPEMAMPQVETGVSATTTASTVGGEVIKGNNATSENAHRNNKKKIFLCVALVVVVILALSLGLTLGLQNDDAVDKSTSASSITESKEEGTGVDVEDHNAASITTTATSSTIASETTTTTATTGNTQLEDGVDESAPTDEGAENAAVEDGANDNSDVDPTQAEPESTPSVVDAPDAAPVINDSDPNASGATPDDDSSSTIPQETSTTQFLASNGPISSSVRMIDASIANGYDSCDDLRDDILNALKHYANSIIESEKNSYWYEDCDPNDPYRPWGWGYGGTAEDTASMEAPEAAPAPEADASASTAAKVEEDSFGTNNQIEGVDEADIVKSDGTWVFAAYGDILFAWNAIDGSKGMSITHLPYNDTQDGNCIKDYYPDYEYDTDYEYLEEDGPIYEPDYEYEGDESSPTANDAGEATASEEPVGSTSSSQGFRRHDRTRRLSMPIYWDPCYKPKPQIISLLLQGTRLTAIVSEENYRSGPYPEDMKTPIISDYQKLSFRVYDVSTVPTDGSPLTLLGERSIKGNYNAARSFDSTGIIISTSYVDTYSFAGPLYRYHEQYCGLNSSEYAALASEIAVNRTVPFMEQMVEELELMGDNCNNIFQIAAMQSGSNDTDSGNSDLLGQFVQVMSFNMEEDFVDGEVSVNVAGAFASGWLSNVFVSQDFAATLNVGSTYNAAERDWDETTYVLGFDLNGDVPTPFCVGSVPGHPLNEYATDLYDGHLRIATTQFNWQQEDDRTKNKIFVLKIPDEEEGEGPEMSLIGESDHLGKKNEDIYAVRYIGDTAYIVTFERIDPFLIVDVSNHSNPVVIGELEIPGFSNYLHPIEIDGVSMILGVGQHVDENNPRGQEGVKISLFDISDPTSPTENATFVDFNAYSNAQHDFHSFRYLPLNQKLILPKSEYTWTSSGNFDGFVVYDISANDISQSYNISHASSSDIYRGCWYSAYLPPRSLVFKSKVTTLLSHSVISTDLDTGNEEWRVNLDKELNVTTNCRPYFIGI